MALYRIGGDDASYRESRNRPRIGSCRCRRQPPWGDVTASGPVDLTGYVVPGASLERSALDALLPAVYGELRALAARHLRAERPDHTLQPTALVHEAYLRIAAVPQVSVLDRSQFFGLAAQMMRRILVNHAESRQAAKRGGGATRVTLDDSVSWGGGQALDLVELDDALTRLAAISPRQAQVVELRFFAGLGIDEASTVLGISPATLKREWTLARAWLRDALRAD
ncbi:MAG: RNA polymerase subunit sigma-70 [Gemmatimonadaceae bacterium]|nr:RNA polymerase subunit sigma-70 [Gemmatimonadaceae bacterium]